MQSEYELIRGTLNIPEQRKATHTPLIPVMQGVIARSVNDSGIPYSPPPPERFSSLVAPTFKATDVHPPPPFGAFAVALQSAAVEAWKGNQSNIIHYCSESLVIQQQVIICLGQWEVSMLFRVE